MRHAYVYLFVGILVNFLAHLALGLWMVLEPPAKSAPFDKISKDELFRRNNWINNGAIMFCGAGLFLGISLYYHDFFGLHRVDNHNPWPVGLAFGLMVILPMVYITLMTLPQGRHRFGEFWRFYELYYKLSSKSIGVFYFLLGALGVYSAYKLLF